ncbi:SWI/SNF-related matrix-associated actin-dependent regulator of chromatin subfamily A containing DEAD/H box 1A [Brachionichthys hirsutus]|uniref:SWI/SNF-related matrix-associated actin-dependent regulator of chromatin subfamily A containing DEAD/H box 1A n=1 Tax=Brachionichthys hirsutus TaxID=412623 RepID=UPI0036051AAD
MSTFNLDRFRFERKAAATTKKDRGCGSTSPESEKENKPGKVKPVPPKSHPRGVVFEEVTTVDLVDDDLRAETKTKTSSTGKSKKAKVHLYHSDDEDDELEERMNRLLEIFPHLSRTELLEVTGSTSTFDGAVAACLLLHGDNESPDQNRKRKQDGSSSSQNSGEMQPRKKRRSSEVSDEDDGESNEPSWEKQEAMVQRLQKRFPDQDKEELRLVLQEHAWNVQDALQALQMFSDTDHISISSNETDGKESGKSKADMSSTSHERTQRGQNGGYISEVEDDTDVTKDSEDSDSEDSEDSVKKKSGSSTLTKWLTKPSDPVSSSSSSSCVKKTTPSSSLKPSTSAATAQRFISGTSIAKRQAAESKMRVRTSNKYASSEDGDDDEDSAASDFEDSNDEHFGGSGLTEPEKEILSFFQNASLDELSLIAGCSIKKATRIVELRPYGSWQSLVDVFHKNNGLSFDLMLGCKVVLKERKVVRGLMTKCEKISLKMVQQVTEVMEKGTGASKQPRILNSQLKLKPYQLIGLNWLLLLHEHKLSAILADEMGLGKTIQAIAFLAQLYQNGIEGPHLIIVPASTLDNWVREFTLWCPRLKVVVYYGSLEERRYLRHDILNEVVDFNVIVTTYNSAIGNESDRSLFRRLNLKYAVFDEGHMLKNMNTHRYRHLMGINAEHRLLLTGTPLQNNLLELMSLLNFIMPSMFSSSSAQLSKMFSRKSHEEQSPFERDRIFQAKLIMKPFILRRVKNEVLKQLPAKQQRVDSCAMSDRQEALYQTLFEKMKAPTNGQKRELCNVIMQLRKMANHPLLHRQYFTTEKLKIMSKLMLKEPTHCDADAALIQEDMEVMSDFELHRLCQQYSSISSYQLETDLLLDSGKFHRLTELLASFKKKGDRVVLFSQFTMMLDIVEVLMKHLKHRYIRLDGTTAIANRIVLIDEFNTDPDIFVFLLSTRAGGLGINLTSANVVILHDIDCNPYNDKQAEDRCHRVGQTRTVQVIKMITKGSVEDCILQLGQKKLKLEQDMTGADQGDEGTITEDMASLIKASLGL